MSLFSTQLQVALEHSRMSRADLAAACGLPYRTLSNYATDRSPPDVEAVRRICCALPEEERPALIAARAADEVPADLRELIFIEPKALGVAAAPQLRPRRELPANIRAALDRLEDAAASSEEWRVAILALADLT
jgi:transcriptional regulator with XRE-family HTH domain